MGWFDDIGDFFGSAGDIAGGVLGVASLASNLIGNDANEKAAERVAAGYETQAQAIRDANADANRRLEALRAETAGSNSYLRGVYANPQALNPQQRSQLNELRRTTANRLATSGLRGAGRAQVAAQRAVESDFITDSIQDNLRRADQAAAQHSGQTAAVTGQQAGIDRATGYAEGGAAVGSSHVTAGADLANAGNTTRAITDLAGYMASEVKGRRSRQQAATDGSEA